MNCLKSISTSSVCILMGGYGFSMGLYAGSEMTDEWVAQGTQPPTIPNTHPPSEAAIFVKNGRLWCCLDAGELYAFIFFIQGQLHLTRTSHLTFMYLFIMHTILLNVMVV